MPEYQIGPRAERDIDSIWDYTAEHWSVVQAEKYVSAIQDMVKTLARNPARGRLVEDIRPGYRRQNVGSHAIFYKIADNGVEIVRVLHQSMDIAAHLNFD